MATARSCLPESLIDFSFERSSKPPDTGCGFSIETTRPAVFGWCSPAIVPCYEGEHHRPTVADIKEKDLIRSSIED